MGLAFCFQHKVHDIISTQPFLSLHVYLAFLISSFVMGPGEIDLVMIPVSSQLSERFKTGNDGK